MRVLLVVVLVKAAAAFAPGALKPRAALPKVLLPRATHLACMGSGSASRDGWERLRGALKPPRARPAAPVLAPAGLALALCAPPVLATVGYETGSVFDPSTFQPVCGTSDSIYRGLQGLIQTVVGAASYREYSPLIAGSLLRVRLELCVVESFFNEAIAPFIRDRGLSWILPLHETVETFLAGVVFALATNFILIGSTKIVTVLVTYADFFFGFPIRLISGAAWDSVAKSLRPKKKPPPPPASAWEWAQRAISRDREKESENWVDTLKAAGGTSKVCRQTAEALDTFVGRYLLLTTVGYIGIKLLHFKVFPDLF